MKNPLEAERKADPEAFLLKYSTVTTVRQTEQLDTASLADASKTAAVHTNSPNTSNVLITKEMKARNDIQYIASKAKEEQQRQTYFK